MTEERIVTAARVAEDVQYEAGLRPRTLDEYIGQERIRENLHVSITAARQRGEALDHVLLSGPPGLGKTTLATVIANELGVAIRATAGPVIESFEDRLELVASGQAVAVLPIGDRRSSLRAGLATVPVEGFPASKVLVATRVGEQNPLVLDFVRSARTHLTGNAPPPLR